QVTEAVTDKAIPYATISAQSDSLKNVVKLCSDVNGRFDVRVNRKGKYVLTFSGVGLKEEVRTIEIGDTTVVDIGNVKMGEGVNLKQVDVVAQKPLIKVDVDKITYSIEADPESQTSNALEMLRKVPLLDVDGEDNVTLNGQSNFKVLVNGKSSSMMSQNFKEVIKSLPANSIKDIEVITNPSSKYEAEGIGGIINIITIKKTLNGYNGSVNAGFDTFGAMNGGIYLSTKVNKFGFSGRYSVNQNKRPEWRSNSSRENFLSSMENQYYMNTSGKSTSSGLFHNFNGEASYDIDSLNLISMSFWGYFGNSNNNGRSVTEIQNSQRVRTSYFEMLNNGSYSYGNLSGNIDYQKTFIKPDKTFTISYKLENNPFTSDNTTETDKEFNYEVSKQHLISDNFTREQTLQVDYYDPLTKKHQIESGVKGIYRQNESNSDVYRLNPLSDQVEYDAVRSNELVYDQTIVGLYGGYVYSPGKFSLKSGLRAELTWNDAISKSVRDTSFSSTLKNVVPYLTLTYKLKPTQTLKLSYTQRLQRPGIWYLNPYRNDLNRLYVYYGNPDLKSEVAHSFEAGYNN
ncbi:MAG: outer membrane beta-barrel family protein, partial [Paludibacter sp.]|nr:outer membrane beta-barrel family protein [Paludibacter sp.]